VRKLAIFSAAFAAACGIYVWLWQDARALWAAGICLFLAISAMFARTVKFHRFAFALFGISVGIVWCFFYQHTVLGPANRADGTEQTVTMQIVEEPWRSDYGYLAEVKVELEGRSLRAAFRCDADVPQLQVGNYITCMAELRCRTDADEYELANGLFLCISPVSEVQVEKGMPSGPVRIRLWLQEQIRSLYKEDRAGLLLALLTGNQQELSFAVKNDMALTGLRHAIAVSGMHVSLLLALLCALCHDQPRLSAIFGVPLVLFFVLMTGASPSACRAAMMQILLLCAPLSGRQRDPLTSMGAAALLLLLQNPWVITNLSFQMSFLSVSGILLWSGKMEERLLSFCKKPGRLIRFLAKGIAPTLSATVATLPVAAVQFGVISLAAPIANLLGLWAVTAMFALGLASCLLAPFGAVLAVPVGLLADYLMALCKWLSQSPFAAAHTQTPFLMIWAACAYIAVTVWLLLPKKRSFLWPACVLTMAFLLCIGSARWQFVRGKGSFTVLDVGQGQCLLLESEGFTAMVDCGSGSPDKAGETAARYLNSVGMTSLDALILTHYDKDHAGGVPQLLHRIDAETVFLPDVTPEHTLRLQVEEAAAADGAQIVYVDLETEISFSGGNIRLFPGDSQESSNESSLCVLATAAEYDILITGDRSSAGEAKLLHQWESEPVDLLVAGHHGADDATSSLLLQLVQPDIVAISLGENNYGHPAEAVLQRIDAAGARVLRTDRDGTIYIQIP